MKPEKPDSVKAWLKHIEQVMKDLRALRGYSRQEDVAERSGLSKGTISNIENGQNPTLKSLLQLLEFYESHPSTLFGSKVPLKYKNKAHERLHEQVQDLLDAPEPWPHTIRVNIRGVHKEFLDDPGGPKDKK